MHKVKRTNFYISFINSVTSAASLGAAAFAASSTSSCVILSGTALLIVVGVANETAAQIESYLIEHRYEGFLASGRLKGRGTR